MELSGQIPIGSVKSAKKIQDIRSKRPQRFVTLLANALWQGAEISIDTHLPQRAICLHQNRAADDLLLKGALLFLSDAEPVQ
jgi:hypothetical protein